MDILESACPQCKEPTVCLDPIDGVLVCENCGFVTDEVNLQSTIANPFSDVPQGVNVDEGNDGTLAGLAFDASGRPVISSVTATNYRHSAASASLMDKVDQCSSTLHVPSMAAEEARQVLRRAWQGKALPLNGPGGAAAAVGGAVYLASRSAGLGLTLREVAGAVQRKPGEVARYYRQLLELEGQKVPSSGVRPLLVRAVAHLLRGITPEGVTPPMPASHPLMRGSLALLELVTRMGLAEGRQPASIAGAVLMLALSSYLPLAPRQRNAAFALTGLPLRPSSEVRHIIAAELLAMAASLPIGAAVVEDNLASYAGLLASFCTTLIAMRRSKARIASTECRVDKDLGQGNKVPSRNGNQMPGRSGKELANGLQECQKQKEPARREGCNLSPTPTTAKQNGTRLAGAASGLDKDPRNGSKVLRGDVDRKREGTRGLLACSQRECEQAHQKEHNVPLVTNVVAQIRADPANSAVRGPGHGNKLSRTDANREHGTKKNKLPGRIGESANQQREGNPLPLTAHLTNKEGVAGGFATGLYNSSRAFSEDVRLKGGLNGERFSNSSRSEWKQQAQEGQCSLPVTLDRATETVNTTGMADITATVVCDSEVQPSRGSEESRAYQNLCCPPPTPHITTRGKGRHVILQNDLRKDQGIGVSNDRIQRQKRGLNTTQLTETRKKLKA